MRITVGGRGEKTTAFDAPPISAESSSLTILTTCWPGFRAPTTSDPSARSLTALVNCLTTLKLTSASSSASRISRIAALMSSSVRVPRCLTPSSVAWSFSERTSNISAQASSAGEALVPGGVAQQRPVVLRQRGADVVELVVPDDLAQRGHDGARVLLGLLDRHALAVGHAAQELVVAERLAPLVVLERSGELGRQVGAELLGLVGADPLAEGAQRGEGDLPGLVGLRAAPLGHLLDDRGGRRPAQRARRPPGGAPEERDERRNEQRTHEQGVDDHADRQEDRQLAERPQRHE